MSKWLKIIFISGFCFAQLNLKAQQQVKINYDFLKHLMEKNLEAERFSYYKCIDFSAANESKLTKDIIYLSAKFNDTLLLKKYTLYAKDTNDLMFVFYGAIVLNTMSVCNKIIDELTLQKLSSNKLIQLNELTTLISGRVNSSTSSSQFYTTTTRIQKLQNKSAIAASLFSMIIPGSGKYYLLQNGEATSALLLNIIAIAPLLENIIKIGLVSTAAFISAFIFIPIYIANIYGTYTAKKSLLKKLKLELKNEVLDYCAYQLRN